MVERLIVDPARPDSGAIGRAAGVIRAGGIVAYPTDTYYGLAVDPCDAVAVARLQAAKRRATGSPFPMIAAEPEQLDGLGVAWSDAARWLAAAFWPGPLTLVLRARAALPAGVRGADSTVAVRVPACPIARSLARALRGPITATSANRSGRPSPVVAEAVVAALGPALALVVDGGAAPGGPASTIVEVTGPAPRLIRPGAVAWRRVLESLEP